MTKDQIAKARAEFLSRNKWIEQFPSDQWDSIIDTEMAYEDIDFCDIGSCEEGSLSEFNRYIAGDR